MRIFFVIGGFWDPILSIWEILKSFFNTLIGFLIQIVNSIPIFLTLIDSVQFYGNYVTAYCAILTPFVAVFFLAIMIRLVADLL